MANTPTVLSGKVKYAAGPPKEGQYGPSINVVVTIDDTGNEVRIYGRPDDPINQLKKGDAVTVIEEEYKGKPAYKIAASKTPAQPIASADGVILPKLPSEMPKEAVIQMAAHAKELARIWVMCYKDMNEAFGDDVTVPDDTIRAATSAVFISIKDKYLR